MEKYHKQDVAPIEKENKRDENYEASNPQIDSERTRNNYRFTPHFGKTYTEFINGRIKELGLSPRKDAVVMNSFVVGSDKTFFDGLSRVEQYNFFSDCYKFFAERYGEENIIAAVVHNDESTPHMHLNLMPVTKDGRLCSKQLFDKPQLQQLQTDFYEAVGKRWGLQRGKEGSQKNHLSTAEFKAKKIIEQAEAVREENQVYADALEEAKSGEIPRKRGRLQEQVIALTAEKLDKIIESLYEDKVEGKISEERYLKMSDTYETEQAGLKERVKTLKSEIAKAKEDDDKILDFMMLIYKYNSFEELTPEILRAFIEKVVVHEKTKVDGHYRQTVEIFYNFVGAIDRPIWGDELTDEDD